MVANTLNLTNVNSVENALKIKSYPNPTNSAFGISVTGGTNGKVEIMAMSSDGKIVYKNTGNTNQNYAFGSNFLPGVYIIKVMQGNTIEILKSIKIM